jgi:hypothetical protein
MVQRCFAFDFGNQFIEIVENRDELQLVEGPS